MENNTANLNKENFSDLLNEHFAENIGIEGSVVKGTVVGVSDDFVTIDVGLKSEGRIPKKEFGHSGHDPEINVGDIVEVYVERMEDIDGHAMLSREKARREDWSVVMRLLIS